ncbi:MAG: elongation factor G [Bacteroidetes bacterium]|nr:elongation factor G [Bacteroidota bacterium]
MKSYTIRDIRNIVLLGHAYSGKTTLAESMLFESGAIKRRGTVEDKNTVSDYHEIEHVRGYSVSMSILHTDWRGTKLNIIDTPGSDDFTGEPTAAMRVCDQGIIVINSQSGVETGTEIIWPKTVKAGLPVAFAVNQCDHEKCNYDKNVEQLKNRFGNKVTVIQYPVNPGIGFNSIVDVLRMTMYKFPADGGKPEKTAIPSSEKEKAEELHRILVEAVAESDEKLMELYFEKGELSEDEMANGLKKAFSSRNIFPVFSLSAKRNMGSGRLMGFFCNAGIIPSDVPQKTTGGDTIPCDQKKPGSFFVFKTLVEPHLGDMVFFRACTGEIKVGMDLINEKTYSSEHLNKIFIVNGKERIEVPSLLAGDIGATVKLKNTHTNQTLHEKPFPVEYELIQFPLHKIQTAIIPVKQGDEEKIFAGLKQMGIEDPTLVVEQSRELRQTILNAQGELHLAVAKWKLENINKVMPEYIKPRIPYRETIQKQAQGHHRHKKQSGGAGQYGEVYLLVEPYKENMPPPAGMSVRATEIIDLQWGGKLVFNNCIVGGVIDARFMPAILKGIMEKMEVGPLTGSYVRDVRVSIHDGSMHDVDSNDISFKIAGMKAFKGAFFEANPKILEPIYDVEVFAPEDVIGEVMRDLQTRRSIIQGMDTDGSYQIIKSRVPLAELYKYSTTLRSLSKGRAYHTLKFSHYAAVPFEIQEKLLDEYKKQEKVEE